MVANSTPKLRYAALFAFAIFFGTIVGIITSEGIIRALVPSQEWVLNNSWALWKADSVLGWTMQPNAELAWNLSSEGRWVIETNSDGIRPKESKPERQANSFRIMLFGGSTALSLAVHPDETLHSQLQQILTSRGLSVEVLNAAVEGYSADQSLLRMNQLLPIYHPDLVIYGFNRQDLEGIVAATQYGLAKPRYIKTSDKGLLLLPLPKPNQQMPDYRARSRILLQHLALFGVIRPWLITLNRDSGNLNVVDPRFLDSKGLNQFDWELLAAEMEEMRLVARKNSAHFAFFSHPELLEAWEPYIKMVLKEIRMEESSYDRFLVEKRLIAFSQQKGILFVPLLSYFRANEHKGPFHLLPRDLHSNRQGYRLTAEAISEVLVMSPIVSAGQNVK